jgi:hypothetical protein
VQPGDVTYAIEATRGGVMPIRATDDRLRSVHLAMIVATLDGHGIERIAALAADELGGAVAIVLPAIDVAVIEPYSSEHQLAALRRYASDRLLPVPVQAPPGLLAAVAVRSRDEPLGFALLLGADPHPHAREILQLASLAAVNAIALEPRSGHGQAPARAALLSDVRGAHPPHPGEIVARARRLGCDLSEGATALCVSLNADRPDATLARIAQEMPCALAAQRGTRIEALLPATDGVLRLARRLRARGPVGLAPFEPDISALGRALRFAELSMSVGDREEIDLEQLLRGSWRALLKLAAADGREIEELVVTTVGPILTPDAGTRTDLRQTLSSFLANDASIAATAGAMHVHRHTVGYRLARIAELTGHDPQTSQGHAQLSLGMQAVELRSAMDAVDAAGG